MKTHYELLGLESSADADAIKKAFRREIARYHPDKVIHLGAEFQEMAATRAAALTVAYKTLTDAALRETYDATLAADLSSAHVAKDSASNATATFASPAPSEPKPDTPPPPTGGTGRFAAERAGRDVILKRAVAARVIGAVETLHGKVDTPTLRGFDLAIVPQAKPRFLGTAPPRVLIKIVDVADAAAITEAYADASRSNVHAGKSPIVVLLLAAKIATQTEIAKANETNARQRKAPNAPEEVAVVIVDIADWSCRLPPNCSPAVHKIASQLTA